jgi:serine phosphatase RsbU (regulator of sigma subunit)
VDGLARRRLTVLLVEDDEVDAFLVRELLNEVSAPVDLRVVATLAQAKAQVDGADCTLLDLNLPDASGLSALRELRAVSPRMAVVVLTGLSDEHVGEEAVANGAQDYLVKGQIDGVLLERAIRYAVERRRAEDAALQLREASLHQAESARLERGLLPRPLVEDLPVGLFAFYRPGRKMGLLSADFYDVVQTGPTQLSVLVGDVCGHAAEEAALGVELRVAWRALTLAAVPDALLLHTLDRLLVSERRNAEIFATLATAHIDVATGRAQVRTVGHPPPLLITGGAAAPLPTKPSALLGLIADNPNVAVDMALPTQPWGILLYTDGLIDGRDGDDRLGTEGLIGLVGQHLATGAPIGDLPGWLVEQAESRNGEPLPDDVAMLLLTSDGSTRTASPAPVERREIS